MTNRQKLLLLSTCGGYAISFMVVLSLKDALVVPTGADHDLSPMKMALALAYGAALLLVNTIFPWLAARFALKTLPPDTLKTLALIVFSVSASGLALAVLTAILGNQPGFTCHIVQALHLLILALSAKAFSSAGRTTTGGTTLLRWCSVLYFLNGWFMPLFAGSLQCMESCTDTGWKLFGLSLFDLNIIVSVFMGFLVWRSVSLAKKKAAGSGPQRDIA